MAGADGLVRVSLDPGRDAHEQASGAGRPRAVQLFHRVEHDVRDTRLCRRAELLVGLVVAVHD